MIAQFKSQDSEYTVKDNDLCDFKASQGYRARLSRPISPKTKQSNKEKAQQNTHTHTHHTKVKLPFDLYIIADFCFVSGLHFRHLTLLN